MAEAGAVLIVGAGPTGMTAAMELSRMAVPVRIVDKLTEFSDTSRALAVQARTMELLSQRGPGAEMARLGNQGRHAVLHGDRNVLGQINFGVVDSRFNYILLLAQSETERILREQLEQQGVAVERGTELVALGQGESKAGTVTAVLRKVNGTLEEVRAPYLIATDGAHSLARHTLGLEFGGASLPQSYALADLHIDGALPEDAVSLFLGGKGLLAAFPLGGKRFRLIATEREGSAGQDDPTVPYMQQLYDREANVPVRLYDMVWSSRFRINSRHVKQLRVGRVFLGGDAAHIHSPAGGQGMNTGIQDMINLCWKLAMVHRGVAQESLLETYQEERMPVIRHLVSTTERATDLLNSGNALVHELVEHVAPLLLSSNVVREAGAGVVSELGVGYRGSPLDGPEHGAGTVRVGDRVPDLPVRVDGEGTTPLLNVLDPSRFTLLLVGGAPVPAALESSPLRGSWLQVLRVESDGEDQGFAERLGTSGWLLVRPDGYLAMRGEGERDVRGVEKWLQRWLATPA